MELQNALPHSGRVAVTADVAKDGFDALQAGKADVVSGWKNKVQTTLANVTPNEMLAEQHRR